MPHLNLRIIFEHLTYWSGHLEELVIFSGGSPRLPPENDITVSLGDIHHKPMASSSLKHCPAWLTTMIITPDSILTFPNFTAHSLENSLLLTREDVGVCSFSVGGHGLNMRGQLIKPLGDSQDPDLVSAFDAVFLQTTGVVAEI